MTEIFSMSQKLCPLTLEELGQDQSTAEQPNRLNQGKMVSQANAQCKERSGWVYKKGRINTAFQKRWLVLKGGMLSYHLARPLVGSEKPQGSLVVEMCDFEEDRGVHVNFGYQFSLNMATREYVFAAPTHNERSKWIMALKSAKGLPGATKPDEDPDEDPDSHEQGILPSVPEMAEPQSLGLSLSPGSVSLEMRKRSLPNGFGHGSPASANGHEGSSPAVPATGESEGAMPQAQGANGWNEEECSLGLSGPDSEAKALVKSIREKRKAEEVSRILHPAVLVLPEMKMTLEWHRAS